MFELSRYSRSLQALILGTSFIFMTTSSASSISTGVFLGKAAFLQSSSQSSATPADIFKEGVQAIKTGNLETAEAAFRKVLELEPNSSAAHINLAVAYMRQKRWAEALTQLHQAEVLSPREAGIQLNLGLVYYRQNNFASAIKPLSAALQATPDSLQARYLLGLCYFFTSNYKQSTLILAPLWQQESTNFNYLYVLSIAAGKSQDAALQTQAFDQMLAIGHDQPEFHLYLGKAWLAQDDTTKALEEFELAAASHPNLPLVHYFLGRTLLKQHDYLQAKAEFLEDIKLEPDVASNYEDLGVVYSQLNQEDAAINSFKLAIVHDPSLVNSYLGLAKLYRKSDRDRDALEMLDHAVELAPRSASIHYLRGQVFARLKEPEQAAKEFAESSRLLKAFNEQIQQEPSGDQTIDAQNAAEQ